MSTETTTYRTLAEKGQEASAYVTVYQHGYYSIALATAIIDGVSRSAMGISKYNPKDKKLVVVKQRRNSIIRKTFPYDAKFGAAVAAARAVKALRNKNYGNYSTTTCVLPITKEKQKMALGKILED